MKKVFTLTCAVLLFALAASAEDIGGKFAFGFEQGIGVGGGGGTDVLGRGVSFKLCLSNVIAVKAALGFNYSQMAKPGISNINQDTLYNEDKDKIDYTAAIYGILVFRRFEKVHLNGMTGLLIAYRDNHFKNEMDSDKDFFGSYTNSREGFKKFDIHLRILMAPEIFLFPNFSLEYKYGFDVAIKKDPVEVDDPQDNDANLLVERKRLNIDVVGDLDLLSSASVHFYF